MTDSFEITSSSTPLEPTHINTLVGAVYPQVANKVAELLMVNEGCDVCCRSPEDVERIERLGLVPDS